VGVNAHVAVIFAAHLNRTHGAIPAGVFTRGDATRVFANPTETFVRVHMSGLELKTFLESAMCSSDPEGAPFPFASGVRWDYDNVTTPAASNFAVLAPGSDRVWVPLDDADAFVVVMPYSVAVDTSNTWSGVGVSSFASGFSRYSVGDGDFKTVFAEHAEALGVLTQTSPGTRSMRTFTGASGVHAHAFDKGNEMHVKLNVTEGQIPVLIQFVSYDACVADAVEGVAVATGVFVAATPETCASATNDAVRIIATGITPGSIDSTGKVVTAEWTNVVHGGAPASASCPTGATTHDLAVALFTFYDAASTPPAYSFPKTAAPISYQSFENLALAMNSSTAIAPSPSLSPSPSTGETGCYALSTDTTPIAGCTCHETCAKCGYFNWPNTDDDCVTCADPSVTVTAVYGDGTGYCTPYTGIPPRAGADVAGSPCYHVIGSDDPASKQRRGTVRFFCDKTGGLTQLKWFATGSPNPGCDMSVPPDELTYGAHSINSRHDLAACDDASEYDVALGRRFPKIEASCGGFDLAAFYSRTDGKVGPFASTYRYRIPVAQRTESAPWGCGTAGCVKARQLGYAV